MVAGEQTRKEHGSWRLWVHCCTDIWVWNSLGSYTKETEADRIWKVWEVGEGCCDMIQTETESMVHFLRLRMGWTELGLSPV